MTGDRVAVLMGGWTSEARVSRVTASFCGQAARNAGWDAVEIEADRNIAATLAEMKPARVFNALHGQIGEDGNIQGLLNIMNIPYTHSGLLASANAMDKVRAKEVFAAAGLPVDEGRLVTREEIERGHPMAPPYVAKPYNEGSSVGVYIVPEGANGPLRLSPDAPETMLVEKFVPGRELTVSVMGGEALAVTDIMASTGWYDYAAKYQAGGSVHEIPARIPPEVEARCLSVAARAHEALRCRGLSRADLRWDESLGAEGVVLLEVNTQPGLTPTSLVPEQALYMGISFPELVANMVEDAQCDS